MGIFSGIRKFNKSFHRQGAKIAKKKFYWEIFMRLFLIRHGETEWALSGRHTSFTDLPLTEHGRAQAAALKARLANLSFVLVLTSPRMRARETCELAGLGEKAVVSEDLREFEYGDYEGLLKSEILAKAPNWVIFRDGCPGGETPAQVVTRVERVIARVRAVDGDVVAFSHGHLSRIFATVWLGLPLMFGTQLKLDTCTVSVLTWENKLASLQSWNCG
jgi:probable phosphoglycerate mutase